MKTEKSIKIKTPGELKIIRKGAKILSSIIRNLTCSLKSGMTTAELDQAAEILVIDKKVKPAFKGYRGFPSCLCVSINHEIVHGIPGARVINEGDIVSIDMGIICDGYYSDMAITVGVGEISVGMKTLLDVTRESLCKGISEARVDNHLSDISAAVQNCAESHGFSVVRDFVGHGIGKNLHEPPEIPNFGPPHCGSILEEGMVFCIEPMVNVGGWQAKIMDDGWTVETLDGKPSAHFEHMVAVTKKGPEILTEF